MKLSESFTQGGQTQLHKLHMIRQVLWATFKASLVIGLVSFLGLIYKDHTWQEFFGLFLYYVSRVREHYSFLPAGFLDTVEFPFGDGQFHTVGCAWVIRDPSMLQFVDIMQHSLLKKGLCAFLIMIGCFAFISYFWVTRGKRRQKKKILQGTTVVTPRELKHLIKRKERSDLRLGGVPLLKDRETEHMMIVGTTGSGKSNCLHHLLKQIRARGERAVIVDTSGSLVSRFFDKGKDKLLNPLDERSEAWDLWSECTEPYHYNELAQSLIPETGADPIWWTSARKLFVATAQKLKKKNQTTIKKLLDYSLLYPLSKVTEFYQETQVASFMNATADKTALSIRSTLGMSLEAFAYLKADNKKPFSIKNWVQQEEGNGKEKAKDWLFLSSKTDQRELLAPLLSTWLSIAYKSLMGLEESYTRRLWFIIDELPSLNTLSNLPKALAEARKYGGCFVIGLQNLPQLEELYGTNLTRSIAGLCGTKVVFRTADAPTAKKLSEFFGEQEIQEAAESISFGAHQMRDGVNLAEQRRLQPTIPYTSLLSLGNLQAYLQLPGHYPMTKIAFEYLVVDKKEPLFIPRDLSEAEIKACNFIKALVHDPNKAASPHSSEPDGLSGIAPQLGQSPSQKEEQALDDGLSLDV